MGLDQFARRVKMSDVVDDFIYTTGVYNSRAIFYDWRECKPLENWMIDLRCAKSKDAHEETDDIRLTAEDLDSLYSAAQEPDFYAGGFYKDVKKEKEVWYSRIMEFVKKARKVIDEGDAVYYSSCF